MSYYPEYIEVNNIEKIQLLIESRLWQHIAEALDSQYINAGRLIVVLDQVVDRWILDMYVPTNTDHINRIVNTLMSMQYWKGWKNYCLERHSCNGVHRLIHHVEHILEKIYNYVNQPHVSILVLIDLIETALPLALAHARTRSSIYNSISFVHLFQAKKL